MRPRLWLELAARCIPLALALLCAAAVLLLGAGRSVSAQEPTATPEPDPLSISTVWVTTQDFSSLRQGPGTGFRRLTVVPPTTTLPAFGRTSDTRWIQVEYAGQRGWIAAMLLVWSGDIIDLPVDGITPYPFVRRAAALGVTIRETPIYSGGATSMTQAGTIPAGTEVELTGRLGGQGFFRFQVRYQGQLYWVGNWDIRITEGDYLRLLDLAYIYPYGQLVQALENDLALSLGSYRQISGVWYRIASGEFVACDPIPPYVTRSLLDEDVAREALFAPAVNALDNATASINAAISAFEDACNDPTFVLTQEIVDQQIAAVQTAEQNLILAGSFLEPLRQRNPLLDESTSPFTGGY